MEPEGSPQSTTGPYPEPLSLHVFTPCTLKTNLNMTSHICLGTQSAFRFLDQYFVCLSHLSHSCYMPRSSHRRWFDDSNNIWWSVQIM